MGLTAGECFAGYTVVRRLGAGGMGEVYLAQHPRLPRREALKVLRKDLSDDDSFRQRFIREADSIAALEHPHIVTVHDRGETDEQLWIATQYVEGADAGQLLRSHYPAGMPADEVADIVTAIAAALDYAHSRGLLHRDVKPANILLADPDPDGTRRVYLADFGIARPLDDPAGLTATNFTLGTVAYAAPEQLMGHSLDGRADQYALAATAYHLLTGTTPFTDSNPVAVIGHHLTATPAPPSHADPRLAPFDAVFTRALAKDPADRYPRCHDFAHALTAAARASGVSSPTADTQAAPIAAARPRTPPAANASEKRPPREANQRLTPTPPAPRPRTKKQMRSNRRAPRTGIPADDYSPEVAAALELPEPAGMRRHANGDGIRNSVASGSEAKSHGIALRTSQRQRDIWVVIASVGLAVFIALIGVVTQRGDEPDSPSAGDARNPVSDAPTSAAGERSPMTDSRNVAAGSRAGDGQLPAFQPPTGLGANCQYPASGQSAAKLVNPPRTGRVPTEPATVSATMSTDQGRIGLNLNNAEAPCTVNNFASLAQKGYYDDTVCHRLTAAPALGVLQCGDPSGTGRGGPGYQFDNEYPTNQYPKGDGALQTPVLYPRGTLAMANAGPDTNGSQFFLVYKDSQLPPNYTVFGTIDATGLETLDKIAAAGVAGGGEDGKPANRVQVKSILLD